MNLYMYYTNSNELLGSDKIPVLFSVKDIVLDLIDVKRRNISLESYIKTSPEWAYKYIGNLQDQFPDGRWIDAEPYIMESPRWAYFYAKNILKDRWIEAETYIMRDPRSSRLYAEDVIKSRWTEAEPYIKQESDEWNEYQQTFGRISTY
jgi:hypothetical protein